jgi:hypothetical protein
MQDRNTTWVVFRKTIPNQGSFLAVCAQPEWEAIERMHPGYHQLVTADLPSEVEAERLARVCHDTPEPPRVTPRAPRWR